MTRFLARILLAGTLVTTMSSCAFSLGGAAAGGAIGYSVDSSTPQHSIPLGGAIGLVGGAVIGLLVCSESTLSQLSGGKADTPWYCAGP
jgi:hypothetical protein